MPPRNVWKPQTYWLNYGWLILVELAYGGSWPSGKRRGSAAPGDDMITFPDQNTSTHTYTTLETRG